MAATPPPEKVPIAIQMSRQLYGVWDAALEDQKNIRGPAPSASIPTLQVAGGKEMPNPFYVNAQTDDELSYLGKFIVESFRSRTENTTVDLTGAVLWKQDLSGIDLSLSNLTKANFYFTNFEGTQLQRIEQFEGSWWNQANWWRAAKMSPQLLAYLTNHFPYKRSIAYPGSPTTEQSYQADLARLRSEQH